MKMTAVMLLSVFTYQLVYPSMSLALTTGPSQPEVQGFEPVGTTDMVDMFSGSFVYNIPLMDVEGYPINIAYHGGVNMEQEASWVGLGWNINPGVINRTIRGIADDANGDSIYKDLNIKPEKTVRVGLGANAELLGAGDPAFSISLNANTNINVSNYRGVSCDFTFGGGVNVFHCLSAGINTGIGSQTGASVDYNAGLSLSSNMILTKDGPAGIGLNVGIGGGYSSRSGIKDLNLSFAMAVQANNTTPTKKTADNKVVEEKDKNGDTHATRHAASGSIFSTGAVIPIGLSNQYPCITNSSIMSTTYGRIKLGGELWGIYPNANVSAMGSTLRYQNDGSRQAFGYMYLQNATPDNASILDFTRDKDGMFNKTMIYLPVPNMTYDIYSLSGQGTGGMFRPFRNDFGSVYDPWTRNASANESKALEVGLGNLFEAGLDISNTNTEITSGPWDYYHRVGTKGFQKPREGKVFENVYLKQGGQMTRSNKAYTLNLDGENPLDEAKALPDINPGSDTARDVRSNLLYHYTAGEVVSGVGIDPVITSYTDREFTSSHTDPTTRRISRIGSGPYQRKKDQVSEIIQVQKDGRKYIYGIPALNNVQREATFTIDAGHGDVDLAAGTVRFSADAASKNNACGNDHYYNSTVSPSYAHSYLLTSVLSTDYLDVTGNGITDDDLGTFTKLNYTRTDSDYRWVAPYSPRLDVAQYNPGYWSDKRDDKASFVCGSREQWYLHSIETKNFIAEFYTSEREDAAGITEPILNSDEKGAIDLFANAKHENSLSYKLDSIKLYNKHDRFINGAAAVPIKTVFFVYDYSLCPGIPNSADGKLTLRKIYFRYGNSQKSMTSPYQFGYGENPGYDFSRKDRWGGYKPNNPDIKNYEFPYVDQNDPDNDVYASAWTLNEIRLPSGGKIVAEYESNDYAFVQGKPAAEMFMIRGIGNSPSFSSGSLLYNNLNNPYLYIYFTRRTSSELGSLSFKENYFGRDSADNIMSCMYFNFNVCIGANSETYEQIKGYASVEDAGICGNDSNYGWIRLKAVIPTGKQGRLNPISFTTINTARYNLPQIVFPGQNPDESDMKNILTGLKGAWEDLLAIGANPVSKLIVMGGAKKTNLRKCYVRLQSVGLRKKGGGQRVKTLTFHDEWNTIAGGLNTDASYGKRYIYAHEDGLYGRISSGVASYEPIIGGDENPLRKPVRYTVQEGSKWPPNDDVDLYQETPIGESLFPSAQVGYSYVEVQSLHKGDGRSTYGIDKYEFYTAKDFPAKVIPSTIKTNTAQSSNFFAQNASMTAIQSYTLIFNDMHGKQKKVEHGVITPNNMEYRAISCQNYYYKCDNAGLNNTVKCIEYNGTEMEVQERRLGVEEDVTIDTRCKKEDTYNSTLNLNLNVFLVFITPVPIPWMFPWQNEAHNEFKSAVVTKVVQQYGILDSIRSNNEGAITTYKNEIYDPLTGQPVVTSITNEYFDKEYSTKIPAYWAYKGMSHSYNNIKYKDKGTIDVGTGFIGTIHLSNESPLQTGDELYITYTDTSGTQQKGTVWVMGIIPTYSPTGVPSCNGINVLPRVPNNTPGWHIGNVLQDVSITVVNSGRKNMLSEIIESYTSMKSPVTTSNILEHSLTDLIDIKASTFADSNTRTTTNIIARNAATRINPYAIGERGQWRLLSEYAYHTDRKYAGTSARDAGLYSAPGLYAPASGYTPPACTISPYNYLAPINVDPNWRAMRTVTKWSPFGKEIENVDAVGNYSTAAYGYNEELVTAVASNAKQGEILSENFEEYALLKSPVDILNLNYSFIDHNSVTSLPSTSPKYNMLLHPTAVTDAEAHTGLHSYLVDNSNYYFGINFYYNPGSMYANASMRYNNYFSNSPVDAYQFGIHNVYVPFGLYSRKTYILNYWIKNAAGASDATDYVLDSNAGVEMSYLTGHSFIQPIKKTNIIDGWQQVEVAFTTPADSATIQIALPVGYYVDDLRLFPAAGNMKAFVYSPNNTGYPGAKQKLIATLDENNFATLYEYDAESNLVRVKKETHKGIMTVSESRNGNPK